MTSERLIPANPPFIPVVIKLECQAEVDMFFAMMNHKKLAENLGLPQVLNGFQTDNYHYYHDMLSNLIP